MKIFSPLYAGRRVLKRYQKTILKFENEAVMLKIDEEVASTDLGPVTITSRITSIDVLRGFALLGIIVLNIDSFASPAEISHDIPLNIVTHTGLTHYIDFLVLTIQWMFFEGKMRALFAALFGAGTIVLLSRLENKTGEGRAADIFHRRSMWLMLFGFIHGVLLWNGDILLLYSISALIFLYPLRNVSAKKLVGAGVAISIFGGTFGIINAAHIVRALPQVAIQQKAFEARAHQQPLTADEKIAEANVTLERKVEIEYASKEIKYGRGSYLSTEPVNAHGEVQYLVFIISSGMIFEIVGLMIAGMGLLKLGFFSAQWSYRSYLSIAVLGYFICWFIVLDGIYHINQLGFSRASTNVWMGLPYIFEEISGMLANASVLLMLVKSGKAKPVQRALAVVGRMAFSNYILTTLVCQFLFKWGPWKLYGVLEFYQESYVVFAIWILNIVFSVLWLRVFTFGPLEWVWRSLTYWKAQPIVPVAHQQIL